MLAVRNQALYNFDWVHNELMLLKALAMDVNAMKETLTVLIPMLNDSGLLDHDLIDKQQAAVEKYVFRDPVPTLLNSGLISDFLSRLLRPLHFLFEGFLLEKTCCSLNQTFKSLESFVSNRNELSSFFSQTLVSVTKTEIYDIINRFQLKFQLQELFGGPKSNGWLAIKDVFSQQFNYTEEELISLGQVDVRINQVLLKALNLTVFSLF